MADDYYDRSSPNDGSGMGTGAVIAVGVLVALVLGAAIGAFFLLDSRSPVPPMAPVAIEVHEHEALPVEPPPAKP